jgi:hypothetical protein
MYRKPYLDIFSGRPRRENDININLERTECETVSRILLVQGKDSDELF